MDIIFIPYARARMLERFIDPKDVEETVRNPDKKEESYGGKILVKKQFKHGGVCVVYRPRGKKIVVKMVYWKKYI